MKILVILFLFAFGLSSINAQRVPPGMNDMRHYKNVQSFLNSAMPKLKNRAILKDAAFKIKEQSKEIQNTLTWVNGGGYLIRIRVYEDLSTHALVALEPQFLGVGSTPTDIVAAAILQPAIMADQPLNLKFSPEKSFYSWITTKKSFSGGNKRDLVYGEIPGVLGQRITLEAMNLIATKDLMYNMMEARKAYFLEGVLANLNEEIIDKEAATRIANQINEYQESKVRLNALQEQLQSDLKKIEQANYVKNFLSNLSSIFSLANLISQVHASIEDLPAAEINNATSPQELTEIVARYQTEKSGRVQSTQGEVIIRSNSFNGLKNTLNQEFLNNNIPGEFIWNFNFDSKKLLN